MSIPQMNFMNWILLFLFFYISVAVTMSWIHYNV